ncbi:DUF4240 domain-containing protein [Streptomyces sp. NPDC088097]|uniref:DUF4240 domain-containing protein n=1 Tax=Streptomyces sp. NPDC088097 TaxID=3365823 RepID=UPI00380B5968
MLARMNKDAFWQLIEDCRPTEPDPEAELLAPALTERLTQCPLSLVTGFAEQLSWALYQLDRKEYGSDLSDDAFLYTCAAVVAAGRDVFESVLQDPAVFKQYATPRACSTRRTVHTSASPGRNGTATRDTPTSRAQTPRAGLTDQRSPTLADGLTSR